MDEESYKDAMLREAANIHVGSSTGTGGDESSAAPSCEQTRHQWQYIRCPCLGIFPGLVCPHADKIQSNGILRATDFDDMLKHHADERGICIDHFAALCVDSERYWVLSLPGRPGSVLPSGEFSPSREGVPGVWVKDVVNGEIVTSLLCSEGGRLDDLLKPAANITQDARLDACRAANPL